MEGGRKKVGKEVGEEVGKYIRNEMSWKGGGKGSTVDWLGWPGWLAWLVGRAGLPGLAGLAGSIKALILDERGLN